MRFSPKNLRTATTLTRLSLIVGLSLIEHAAYANPQGGTVTYGSATLSSANKTLTITQTTDKAILNWQSFNIASDETTAFIQPSTSSIALNRILDTNPSEILGTLTANGTIALINPNGILFGKDSQINVGSLLASTADIDDEDFKANKFAFSKKGNADATIVNLGTITVREAGLVGFVAPNILNAGTITAKLGRIHLASGDTATVDFYGDGLMEVAVSDDVTSQTLLNSGTLSANGGTVALTAAAGGQIVNSLIANVGTIEAKSVGDKTGTILLYAEGTNATQNKLASRTGTSTVLNSGILNASGRNAGERGGDITVTGDNVGLLAGTIIDASGADGASNTTDGKAVSAVREGSAGGNIKIGGDYLGSGTTPHALNLYVDSDAYIFNDALNSGDAGRTIFWSDNTTTFYGNVFARALGGLSADLTTGYATAGGNAGNGGFVETSGKENLIAGGYVDLTTSAGEKGTYFLDPTNISIYGNVTPTYVSTDNSINLASSLKLWLDSSDATTVTLTYNNLSITASGSSGSMTLTVSDASSLKVGERVRLGSAGSTTTADMLGADTYTIASISGTTVTLTSALTSDYSASAVYGGYVSTLADKSGNGYDATQTTTSQMPLWLSNAQNGNSVLNLSGNEYLTNASAWNQWLGDIALIMTAQPTSSVYYSGYFSVIPSSGSDYNSLTGIDLEMGPTIDNVRFSVNNTFVDGSTTAATPYIISVNQDAVVGNTSLYLNSLLAGEALTPFPMGTSNNGYLLGSRYPSTAYSFQGNIEDTLLYKNSLSLDELVLVNQYEAAKWGLSLTGPGTGSTEVEQATASNGYSVFTTRYLEKLSQSANISLQATNNITLDLQGDTLNFTTEGRSLTLTAGNLIITDSNGTIQTNGGDITLEGVNALYLTNGSTKSLNLNSNGGNITLTTDTLISNGSNTINAGTGTVTIEPGTSSTSIGINGGAGTLQITSQALSTIQSASRVVLGDATAGTGDVTIEGYDLRNKTYDLEIDGGNITLENDNLYLNNDNDIKLNARAGNLTLNRGIQKSGGSASTVDLTASGFVMIGSSISGVASSPIDLNVSAGSYIYDTSDISTYGGDIVFRATASDLANTDTTYAAIGITNATLNSSGGDIIFGGGSASDAEGRPTGYAASAERQGVALNGSTLTAGGGDIVLRGSNAGTSGSAVDIINAVVKTTGAGNITITGLQTGADSGVYFNNLATISAESGNIDVAGQGSAGTSHYGLTFQSGGTYKIYTTSGNISLTASGNSTYGDFNFGGITYIGTDNAGTVTSGIVTLTATGLGDLSLTSAPTLLSLNRLNINAKHNLTINKALSGYNNNPMDIYLTAGNYIYDTANITSYGGDIVFRASANDVASTSSTYSAIQLSGVTVSSGGGNIILGGGSALDGNGYPTGPAQSSGNRGVQTSGSTLSADGGDIWLSGETTLPIPVTSTYFLSSTIRTTGQGNIEIYGEDRNLNAIKFSKSNVLAEEGNILISGISYTGSPALAFDTGTNVITTTSGSIELISRGENTARNGNFDSETYIGTTPEGVVTTGVVTLTTTGNVYIYTNDDLHLASQSEIKLSSENYIYYNTGIISSGSAHPNVILEAHSYIQATGTIATNGGDIIFRSNKDDVASTDTNNAAIYLNGLSLITSGGDIALGGGSASDTEGRPTGYATSSGSYGINISNSVINASDGTIQAKGSSSASSTAGLVISQSTIRSTDNGAILLEGVQTATYMGIYFSYTNDISTEKGSLTLLGTGGTNSNGIAVNASSTTKIYSETGDISLTGIGNGTGADINLAGTVFIGTDGAGTTTSGIVSLTATGAGNLTTPSNLTLASQNKIELTAKNNLTVNNALSGTTGSPVSLWFTAGQSIVLNSDLTTYGGDVILRANAWDTPSTTASTPAIKARYITITTSGGDIIFGGGSASDAEGRPTGYAESSVYYGISSGESTFDAGGGDIILRGKTTYTSSWVEGLNLGNETLQTTGNGSILIEGASNGGYNALVLDASISLSTEAGNISILANNAGTGWGVVFYSGSESTISTTTGNITIEGVSTLGGGVSLSSNSSTKIYSNSGDIKITGSGGTNDFSLSGTGYIGTDGSSITTTGLVSLIATGQGTLTYAGSHVLASQSRIELSAKDHILLTGSLSGSAEHPVDIYLTAGNYIRDAANITTYGGDIVMRANENNVAATDTTYGAIDIRNATLLTSGGDIILGGGSATDTEGRPTGYATSAIKQGVYLGSATLDADGGNILIKAEGQGSAGAAMTLTNATLLSSGEGIINIAAKHTGSDAANGLSLSGLTTIATERGEIAIQGDGTLSKTGIDFITGGTYKVYSSSGNITLIGNSPTTDIGLNGTLLIGTNGEGTTTSGHILLQSANDNGLKLGTQVKIAATGSGTITLDAGSGAFINNRGSDALTVGTSGRWLVYSGDPANDTRGGLTYDFKQYNAAYGSTVLGNGSGYIYAIAPTLSIDLQGLITKTYDGTLTASLSGSNYTVSGLIDGDAATFSIDGVYDTKNIGTNKTVEAAFNLTGAQNGSITVYGYTLTTPVVSASIGEITKAALVIRANDAVRFVGKANPVFTSSYIGLQDSDAISAGISGLAYTTEATVYSPTGGYTITPYGATSSNYVLVFESGTLTIMELPNTVTAITQDDTTEAGRSVNEKKPEKTLPSRYEEEEVEKRSNILHLEIEPSLKKSLHYE